MRTTLSTSFNISGSTGDPGGVGGDCVTDGGSGTTTNLLSIAAGADQATSTLAILTLDTLTALGAPDNTYASQGMVHNGTTMTIVAALPTPLTITTTMPSVDIAFDVSAGLGSVNNGNNGCLLFPAAPTISMTLN